MNLKPNQVFVLCLLVLVVLGTIVFLKIEDIELFKVTTDGVEASFREKMAPSSDEPLSDESSSTFPENNSLDKPPDTDGKPASEDHSNISAPYDKGKIAPDLSTQFDTLELILDSQLKAGTLLIDGIEPEILERTSLVLKAKFKHVTGNHKIELRSDKFTCTIPASFSGKKQLSLTMSNCKSN